MEEFKRHHFLSVCWLIGLALIATYSANCSRRVPEDLVDLATIDSTIVIDLKYASEDNFVGERLYSIQRAILRRSVAERLERVQTRLRLHGLGLKVWDAYRPLSVQWKMWKLVHNPKYVADPRRGSRHNRGAAVDVTLVDLRGNELEMPTKFDDFSEAARSDNQDCSEVAIDNRAILHNAMEAEGFQPLSSEWWHFDDPKWEQFEVIDVPLEGVRVD